MVANPYQLSLVIVSWNTRSLLLNCLASIEAQRNSETFEVIVVDNASQDGSVAAVQGQFPRVVVIENQTNRGFAAACNQGIKQSSAPIVGLLNPDTEIQEDALVLLIQTLQTDARCLAVGPQLLNPDGSLQPSGRRFPSMTRTFMEGVLPEKWKRTALWRRSVYGRNDFQNPAHVNELSGACFLTRREWFDKIGLLDEGYFIYFEEVDWFKRLQKQPGHVLYQPAAQVMHCWAASISQCGDQALQWHYSALFRYWAKHHGWFWTLGIRKVVFFQALLGSVTYFILACLFIKSWQQCFKALQRYRLMMRMVLKGGQR